jgi:hypothetical protein
MGNGVVRMPGAQNMPQQQGDWVWDGSNWVCDPSCDGGSGFPPFGPPVFSGPTQQPPWYPGANGGVSFGAVAPSNPVRGHMWWDGMTFWLFDGAAWVGVGGTASPPLLGVTDGSYAKAGFVGETMFQQATGSFPNTQAFTQSISTIILPPGDWNVSVFLQLVGAYTTGTYFYLNPQPAGISTSMRSVTGAISVVTGVDLTDQSITGNVAQANVKVPTLLAFTLVTNYGGATTQGTGTFIWETFARRMR